MTDLYAQAMASPKRLGAVEMTRNQPFVTRLYGMKQAARGCLHRWISVRVARDKRSRVHGRREREPWLLASKLPETQWNAAQVVALYERRMQIEEGFRDVKSAPLGLGFGRHRSRCPKRIEVLLLIAALANYLVLLVDFLRGQPRRPHLGGPTLPAKSTEA